MAPWCIDPQHEVPRTAGDGPTTSSKRKRRTPSEALLLRCGSEERERFVRATDE